MSRKKSIDVSNLPEVPEIPTESNNALSNNKKLNLKGETNDRLVKMLNNLNNLKEHEASLFENIKTLDSENVDINQAAEMSATNVTNRNNNLCEEEECRDYIAPLMTHTQGTIIQLLQTKESLDQLDKLHTIIQQLLMVQEQNYQMRKRLKTVKTLNALKEMEIQMNSDPEKFIKSSGFEDGSDMENETEFEQNIEYLEAMLNASRSASNKRSASKKQRSKSIISEEASSPLKENNRNYPLRRQSAISDFKPKVSKWTKVKAAFKWEKANTLHLSESKSSDSILSPNSNFKNFLKVPQCQSCNSANSGNESLVSTSSGKVLTATTKYIDEISSAPSSADENENDEITKASYNVRPPSFHDDERRSHSLDGDLMYGANSQEKSSNKNNKSAWSKVKGKILTSRNSRKSIKSTGSANSRDVSPIEVNELQRDRSDSISSPNQSSSSPNNLNLPDIDLCQTSDEYENRKCDLKSVRHKKGMKKNKLILEIESLPEDETFESYKKQLPSPLILKKDFSESDSVEGNLSSITPTMKKFYYQRNLSVSDPNSPLKTQEFFSEDFSSGADNDYSEPLSPLKRGSNNSSSRSSRQHNEILRNYHELQKKINLEFESKQQEWSRMRPLVLQLNNSVPSYLKEDLSLPSTPKKEIIDNLILNEENLSADFKRKLEEWRVKKGHQSMKDGSKKQQAGQMKFENQGLVALTKDLPEDFQKKLNEWKQMKSEGRSPPPYSHQTSVQEKLKRQFSKTDKSSSNESSMKRSKTQDVEELPTKLKSIASAKEIVVQTSDGLMKFKGISRSFTRKLYEWEKAKGIDVLSDSSTFAFLHPKYQIPIDENENLEAENDKSCMKRALSVDSIKPVQYNSQMSHQPSSLSLNDADNLKEPADKKASSNIEIYRNEKENSAEEPEAVIVEVEDEGFEIIPTPTVSSQMQIPVFKFDFANKDLKSDLDRDEATINNDVKNLLSDLKSSFSSISDLSLITDAHIKHLNVNLRNLYESLSQLKFLKKEGENEDLNIAVALSKELYEMFNEFHARSSPPSSHNLLHDMNSKQLKIEESLKSMENSQDNKKFQATSSIQSNSEDIGIATIKITPTFICNSIKVDESTNNNNNNNNNAMHLKVSSESEMPELSTEDMRSDDKLSKKVARNASSSSKRKIRLRRMGSSRQNSKTESDSDDEYALNSEAQRKIKRKSSRATKKQLESDKSFDSFQGEEEVVYVFKIKPGETNEVIAKTVDNSHTDTKHSSDSILISPTENCVELIDVSSNDICQTTYTNPIVKTKRKIFTPFELDGANKNSSLTCITHEIESSSSSSGSEKTDNNKVIEDERENTKTETEVETSDIHNLSFNHQDKSEISKKALTKDLSPSIRLMIEKYHQNIDQKSTPNSNSSSPLWLSPVLDRRVRKQSAEYQFKIMKSNSFQENDEDDKNDDLNVITCEEEVKEEAENKQNELKIESPQIQSSTGAIPKIIIPKTLPHIQVDRSSSDIMNESVDLVLKRSESDKPRTPLSERALKIKQAKEAFFKSTISPTDERENWNYRFSQISVGSTDSNSIENMSCSTSMLLTKDPVLKVFHDENKTSSLPRNVTQSDSSEFQRDLPKNSKFGFSTLATKFRKVKLKRASKEAQKQNMKMNTVPVLCRQSLNVDLFNESSTSNEPNGSQLKMPNDDNVKKSKSLGKF